MHSPAKPKGSGTCRGMYSPATGSDMCCRGVCTVEVEQSHPLPPPTAQDDAPPRTRNHRPLTR
eukprot:7380856-Prymnesium_polylepis.1